MSKIENSYKKINGKAINIWLNGSGGVNNADRIKKAIYKAVGK